MPIQLLSDSDIRSLLSSLVLTDSRSVIKELIDNALDAHASIISIEISANTVDVIQLKDNGSGIGGEDRHLVCRRGCTSKIRTIQDLENLGGSSLGFRGEALASVAALSNAVLVTTRIDGELIGYHYGSHETHFYSSSSASHPVGTTIRVQDFLKTIPVRRQTALKVASRTLSDIKKLLQAYAFARPNTRISFKVLKAKTDRSNWTYGPRPGSTSLLDATAKIVGQEVAAQCETTHWKSEKEGVETSLIVDAIVASAESDPIKVGNKGHFISIDGRPVSAKRGIFKDFVKLYKTYFRHWISSTKSIDSSVDPFLCLQMRCPAGSYDVNIEPAKDEVLFTDTERVRDLLKEFLKSVYGDLPEETEKKRSHNDRSASSIAKSQGFELLLAKRDHSLQDGVTDASHLAQGQDVTFGYGELPEDAGFESSVPAAGETAPVHNENDESAFNQTLNTSGRPRRNMYEFDEEDMSTVEPPLSQDQCSAAETEDAELRKASVTNPWAIAKLNASVSSTRTLPSTAGYGNVNDQLLTPAPDSKTTGSVSTTHRPSVAARTNLPSPARSDSSRSPPRYQNPGPPLRRRAPVRQGEADAIEFTQEPTDNGSTHTNPTFLESWAKSMARTEIADRDARFKTPNEEKKRITENAQTEIQSTHLTDPVDGPRQTTQPRSPFRTPFVSPLKTPERRLAIHPPMNLTPTASPCLEQPFDQRSTNTASHAHPPPLSQSHQHPMASPPRLNPSPPQLPLPPKQASQTSRSDLDEIMDFEHRKRAVNAQRKSQSRLTNRYLSPGQLAQIQRESTASLEASEQSLSSASTLRRRPAPNPNPRGETEESHCPGRPSGPSNSDRLPTSSQSAETLSQKQSPHQNRYQAAKAALTRPRPVALLSQIHSTADHGPAAANTNFDESLPPLPEEDPRAYLIEHRTISLRHKNEHSIPGLTRTGLNIRRTKTSKLPLETVPPDSSIHHISARPSTPFPSVQSLTAQINGLGKIDRYLGTGKNDFMFWDANSAELVIWEENLKGLVSQQYMARLGTDGERAPANLQLRLGIALRAHAKEFA